MTSIIQQTITELHTLDDQLVVLSLERELAGPDGARICASYLTQFKNHLEHIESLQRSGLTPTQFNKSETLRNALQSAIKCLSLHQSLLQ